MKKIYCISISLIFITILVSGCSSGKNSGQPISAIKGIINLRNLDLINCEPVLLNGEWEFYWNQLLTPEDFQRESLPGLEYQRVPHIWNLNGPKENRRPSFGFGTYRLMILLDDAENIFAVQMKEIFTFGALLIMGLYHFGLFYQRRTELSFLYFAIFCLIIASRVLVTDENFLVHLIPEASWQLRTKIIVFGYYTGLPVFAAFLYTLFPGEFNNRIISIIRIIGYSAAAVVLFTPPIIFTKTEVYVQVFILITAFYLLGTIIRAVFRKKEGALLILIGISSLLISVVNDILYAQYMSEITNRQSLMPLGLFIFIIIQALSFYDIYSKEDSPLEVLIKKSDKALYKAKSTGRNRVEISE